VTLKICEIKTGNTYSWTGKDLRLNEDLSFNFTHGIKDYQVQLYIDGHIAYSNCFSEAEMPF